MDQPVNPDDGQRTEMEPPAPDELRELVLDHYQDVYRYAYRLSGSSADAEDLTQQTFLIAHRKLGQLRQAASMKAWLLAVLRSCFLKTCRRSTPLTGQQLTVDEMVDRSPTEKTFDDERLQAAISSLPAEFRIVVVMFYFDEKPYKEIAEELGIPTGTVMSRLSRAKGRLRQQLLAKGGAPDWSREEDSSLFSVLSTPPGERSGDPSRR